MVKKEQQTEKKKPGIYRRILKWIGLTFLTVLIILSLIFQAPWKVITLLLIILAACTVLPKPAKKWFWLSVAAIVLILIIWVFLPEDSEGWRPYTFDKELAALEAKYAIPDFENAATIYKALLEAYEPNAMRPDFLDPNLDNLTLRESWSGKDHPELAKCLEGHQDTIAKLFEASEVEKCSFPITHDILSMSDTVEYLPKIRQWAFLLVRAGNNDMAEGRIEEGLEKYLCVKKIGGHMQQQSSMTEILVGMAVEDLADARLKVFIVTADTTEEHLSLIEKAVEDIEYDWASDFTRILECDKLMMKNIWALFYEVNSEGRIRFARRQRAPCRTDRQCRLEDMRPQSFWQKKLRKAGAIWAWFFFPASPQKAGEIIDAEYEKYYAMTEPDFDWQRELPDLPELVSLLTSWNFTRISFDFNYSTEFTIAMVEEIYCGFHDLYLRNIAEQRGTLLVIALRRYKNENGQWPQKLDDIKSIAPAEIFVDPFNGDSFVYKLTEENFTLYSKGKNNIDEDGEDERCVDSRTGADDWLIWP